MAAPTGPGIFTLSKLYIDTDGTALTATEIAALTATTVETQITASTVIEGVNNLTALGNVRTIERSEVLGEAGARAYLGQINIPDLTFPMDMDLTDAGQLLLRNGLLVPRTFVANGIDPSGGDVYYAFNAIYQTSDDLSPNSKALTNVTLTVSGAMKILVGTT